MSTTEFGKIYQSLNERQRLAVDTLEGPVMVIAGPGTGKTQVLTARIGRILTETDTQPGNILCLTYTDAGAVAMRKRLLTFIGPDAYKVRINTFHAFCHEIIQENLSHFEKTSLDPISELERMQLLKELIDSFPKNHLLKRYRGDVYYEADRLANLFSRMKKEGWTPAWINEKIDEYLKSLPEKDEFKAKKAAGGFKKGDVRTDWIRDEEEEMNKLRAAVAEFDRFQSRMKQLGRYDFDDMINWVIRAFSEDENLLRRYQEQFLYILVDEYQDTSGTQNRLVELLTSYWDTPNIFVVGDDDQSIFRFQGANLENMKALGDRYQDDLVKVVLTHNYRSVQSILDLSKSLIEKNTQRLVYTMDGLSKELIAANEKLPRPGNRPVVKEFETQSQEMIGITLELEKLIREKVQPSSIAVIYKENKFGLELAQHCALRKIPVFTKRNLNVLDIPLARKIITLLRWLVAEHELPFSGDSLLFEILHYDWFGIPPIEIARLSVEVYKRQFEENKTYLRALLQDRANLPARDLFEKAPPPAMKRAARILEELIADLPNQTLQVFFENLIRKTGILQQIMKKGNKFWLLQVLTALFDFVKAETHKNPRLRVSDLVSLFEMMDKENIALPLVQVSGSEKGVNFLTAHGSKGLEYEYVFFAGINAGLWEKKRSQSKGYSIPEMIIPGLRGKEADMEEMRRLFYVAMTRAGQHLCFSYSTFNSQGKEWEPSMFLAEVMAAGKIPAQKVFLDEEVLAEFQLLAFDQSEPPELAITEADFIDAQLDKFVMNVTALNNYLKCPLEFYYRNLIRIPSPKNENTEFGTAVHHALEQLFRKMQANGETFPPVADFVGYFDGYMQRHRESFTNEQFARRLEYGHMILPEYYEANHRQWNRVVGIEKKISQVAVNGVPLKGKLDKLEFTGNDVNIVDYKTGDPDKAKAKLSPPGEKEPNGGDYWRQAVFYKILLDHYTLKNWRAVSVTFDFIEPDGNKKYQKKNLVVRPEDITTVTQQITDTWEKLKKHDFYKGCGEEDCHWCNFVKDNDLGPVSSEEEDETDELPDLMEY